jgi:16S rRNA (guanine1207-N2)-methyltransferase
MCLRFRQSIDPVKNLALETLMLACDSHGGPRPEQILFIGAQAHAALRDQANVLGWQPLKPLAEAWDKAGFSRSDTLPEGKWPWVLVLPQKSRDETLTWFALARDRLALGGSLIIAIPNNAGASRFEKELVRATGRVESIQKHKCRAFIATDDGSWDEAIFAEWRELGHERKIPGTDFITQAGIFSSAHIDPGSLLLAQHLPKSLRGRVADLGAGWGFLSNVALHVCEGITHIDLYEADARALECARKNLASYNEKTAFHWHDVTSGLAENYDAIFMNPPFHSGQATDVDLGRAFIKSAAAALRRGGKLLLVANRQLPYEAVLESNALAWRKIAEDPTYKIIFAEKR